VTVRGSKPVSGLGVEPGTGRLAWLDYAKGLGIILVVLGHANRSIERTGDIAWSDHLRFLDEVIYDFHMPLFFVLAGIAVGLQRNTGCSAAWRSIWWGIVLPYVIWTVVWIAMKLVFPGASNHPLTVSHLLRAGFEPVEHMWFLYHLFFARVLWLGWSLVDPGRDRAWVVIALAFLAGSYLGGTPGWSDAIGYFLGNVGFVGVGMLLAPGLASPGARRETAQNVLLWGAVFVLLFLVLRPEKVSAPEFVVAAAGAALIIFAARLLATLAPSPGLRALAFLGEASLAIYVLHLFVIAIVRVVLKSVSLTSEPALLIAGTAAGLVVPAIAFALVLRAGAEFDRPLARWVGFGTARCSHYFKLTPAAVRHAVAST